MPPVERVAALPDEHFDLSPLLFRYVLAPALGATKRLLSFVHEDVHGGVEVLVAAEAAFQELEPDKHPAVLVALAGRARRRRRDPHR